MFSLSCFFPFEIDWVGCLYIWQINPLSISSFANIFSHSKGWDFVLFCLLLNLLCKSFLSLTKSHLLITQPPREIKIMPFAEAWIDLGNVIYSEVNQKENKVSHNIVYMWNLEKMVQMNLFAKKKKRERREKENKLIDTNWGRGWMK